MRYIPHRGFRWDDSAGGGIVAHNPPFDYPVVPEANDFDWTAPTSMLCHIDMNKLISNFGKAEQTPSGFYGTGYSLYGFVREDGCEFAISPIITRYRVDFVGYWRIPFELSPSDWETFGLLSLPIHMVEFLRWGEEVCDLRY